MPARYYTGPSRTDTEVVVGVDEFKKRIAKGLPANHQPIEFISPTTNRSVFILTTVPEPKSRGQDGVSTDQSSKSAPSVPDSSES